MTAIESMIETDGRAFIAGAPEGLSALALAHLAEGLGGTVLHVARDDVRLTHMAEGLAFFAPDIPVLKVPAWDCLPYDRISPNADVLAARMKALSLLASEPEPDQPRVVITTINGLLQRLPAREVVSNSVFRASRGETVDLDELLSFLNRNGFGRVSTVVEHGEFAVRGSIVDLFPPGAENPVRLDFFGDVLDTIRSFDPLDQRSQETLETLDLGPASEIFLDEDSIQRFRKGYHNLFGAITDDDPLYEAVSAGRRHAGVEHWLPLFHDHLETLFDYLPNAAITLDELSDEARDARLDLIEDYYKARSGERDMRLAGPRYRPVPPHLMYLDQKAWEANLQGRIVREFTSYNAPEEREGGITTDRLVPWINLGGKPGRDFAPERMHPDQNPLDALKGHVERQRRNGRRTVMACFSPGSAERFGSLLSDHGFTGLEMASNWAAIAKMTADAIALVVLPLERGFEDANTVFISEQDVLGDRLIHHARRSRKAENFLTEASSITAGDYIVHVDHGIGRFDGLVTIDVSGAPHDCLLLTYQDGDKLYVPVENIEVLSRYGSADAVVALDRLGGAGWQSRKARAKKRIREIAGDLIKLAAARELKTAPAFPATDGMYEEFCARFPYDETEDQHRAIEEVMDDLSAGKPMDRLICGDVGFGKTEVALRSAFVAAMAGRQVAVVVPTTLLARQHTATFRERFVGYPIEIEQLSRFVPRKTAEKIKEGMKNGQVDIVIGTHALLAKSIDFKNLGLLIIDEEQHFGVIHKEQLKKLRADIHVLTLTATPIPRTLQLALTGIRGMSLIATPPVDRLAVRTFVLPFDTLTIREALLREHYRGGQSFYVCPRVADLPEAEDFLKEHVPEVKFAIVHGQLPTREIEDVMNAYYDGRYDVLLCTNIVESGLDIPAANTMIIHRADMFGLAQLYQLRGRIGRSKVRGYAYLTVRARGIVTADAEKRLKVMQSLDTLGAGFSVASHDLDIRGGGNLLGEEQSGNIREVGVELYQHMLEEALALARTGVGFEDAEGDDQWSPQIALGTAVLIPEDYVNDLDLRMGLYRRLAGLETEQEVEGFAAELIDRFGPLPDEVEHLMKVVHIKRFCRNANIAKIDAGARGATLSFRNNDFSNPGGLIDFITSQSGTAKLRPDHTLVYMRRWDNSDERLEGVRYLVSSLARLAVG